MVQTLCLSLQGAWVWSLVREWISCMPHGGKIYILVVQSLSRVWLFVTPWTAAHQTSLSFTISWSLLKLVSIESVIPFNHLILCHPLLQSLIFSRIRVLSRKLVLHIRWPKHWRFSFSPSSEYTGLISFSTHWFDLVRLLLSYAWLFVTPWAAASQAPRFSAISWSLLKFMSIESVMLSKHLPPSVTPFCYCLQSFPASGSFQWVSSSHHVAKVQVSQLHIILKICIYILSIKIIEQELANYGP